jgi:hypothetical protein
MMRLLMALALASLNAACALQGFGTELTSIPLATAGATSIYSGPADQRSIVVVQSPATIVETTTTTGGVTTVTRTNYPSQTYVCPQPPGDVAYSRTAETLFKLGVDAPATGTDGNLDSAFRAGAAAAELAGRSPTVLLAREMLSFTCVQSALPPNAMAEANFNRLADMLENFSAAERQRAAAAVVQAQADAVDARVDNAVVEEIVLQGRTVRETRTNAIVANLSLPNGSLNTAKVRTVADVAAVQRALGPSELGAFRNLRSVPDLRGFLIDIELPELAVLETASKP